MARLPVSGSDAGAWGPVLNEYLTVGHRADGALKTRNYLNVLDQGATGNGSTNDTAAINAAITAAAGARPIVFPAGTYMVDANYAGGQGVRLNVAKTHLILERGATLQAITNSATAYAVVGVSAPDCVIEGGTIRGDLGAHTGSTGEWGHCVEAFTNSHRLLIKDTTLTRAWGDGFCTWVGLKPQDITLLNVTATDNRRQGASIVDAIRPRVIGGTYSNTGATGWTLPSAGLDIEPDPASGQSVTDALLVGVTMSGNRGPGLLVASNSETVSGTAVGCRFIGNGVNGGAAAGFHMQGANNTFSLVGCDSTGNTQDGFYIETASDGASLRGCRATDNDRFGYLDAGVRSRFVGCESSANAGVGYYLDAGATTPTLSGCLSVRDCASLAGQSFDVYAAGSRLSGCIAEAGTSTAYGFVVRASGTNVRIVGCDTKGTFGTAAVLDSATGTVMLPVPGVGKQTLGSAATDAASTQTLANNLRTALINFGLGQT